MGGGVEGVRLLLANQLSECLPCPRRPYILLHLNRPHDAPGFTRGLLLLCLLVLPACSPSLAAPPCAVQENLMEHLGDPHTWPNIDMTQCLAVGKEVELGGALYLAAA